MLATICADWHFHYIAVVAVPLTFVKKVPSFPVTANFRKILSQLCSGSSIKKQSILATISADGQFHDVAVTISAVRSTLSGLYQHSADSFQTLRRLFVSTKRRWRLYWYLTGCRRWEENQGAGDTGTCDLRVVMLTTDCRVACLEGGGGGEGGRRVDKFSVYVCSQSKEMSWGEGGRATGKGLRILTPLA
jgi:hypothetical protein